MESLALRCKEEFPTSEILNLALQTSFPAYRQLEQELTDTGIKIEWRYYNDGKAWMGKLIHNNKKNLGWLHVYPEYFTVTCFFTEKNMDSIVQSDLPQTMKDEFMQLPFDSRLKGMSVTVRSTDQLMDIHQLLKLKKRLK